MRAFRYVATGMDGRESTGLLDSLDERDAVLRLSRMGLFAVEVSPVVREAAHGAARSASASAAAAPIGPDRPIFPGLFGVRPHEVTELARQLATFLGAGFPLASALAFIRKNAASTRLAALVGEIHAVVRDGGRLSVALAAHPQHFHEIEISLVAAGEESGTLPLMFERLASMRERSAELRAEVFGALAYPAFLVVAMVVSVLVLLGFVVPRFAQMFTDLGGELPLPTQLLLAAADLVRAYGYALPVAAAVALLGLRRMTSTAAGRARLEALVRRLPVVGPLAVRVTVARFGRTLGTLLGSGVALLRALTCLRGGTGSALTDAALEGCLADVRDGKPLAEALAASGAFPEELVAMVRVGEESSRVAEMLVRVAEASERKVAVLVKGFVRLLEPVLIVAMGAVVGGIVLAMMLPMFEMNLLAM